MRIALIAAGLALALAGLAGCGGSNDESETPRPGGYGAASDSAAPPAAEGRAPAGATARACAPLPRFKAALVRATEVACGPARRLIASFARSPACADGAARTACKVRGYRCSALRVGAGRSVSCSRPGRSVAFVIARG